MNVFSNIGYQLNLYIFYLHTLRSLYYTGNAYILEELLSKGSGN